MDRHYPTVRKEKGRTVVPGQARPRQNDLAKQAKKRYTSTIPNQPTSNSQTSITLNQSTPHSQTSTILNQPTPIKQFKHSQHDIFHNPTIHHALKKSLHYPHPYHIYQ
jgi:hypothetical protein